jgi:nucleoside-diphosphate-sugar epimerase
MCWRYNASSDCRGQRILDYRYMGKLIVGCGYLGRRVARLWLAQGQRVFGTTRSERRAAELRGLGVEPVLCDVLDAAGLKAVPAVQSVLYCVGLDRSAGRSMRDVYVDGFSNFLASCRSKPPEAFIYVSSTSVYGQCQGEEVDEMAATEPLEDSGQVVLEAEKVVRGAWPDGITVLRFAGIYGPGRVIRQQAVAAGETLVGDPDKWLNLIHVDDGAAAVLAAEERGMSNGIYNVSDGHPVRRRDYYARLAQLLGAPEPRLTPPGSGAPLPPHERANRRISNRRLREELGLTLRYASFEEGLRASLAAHAPAGPAT